MMDFLTSHQRLGRPIPLDEHAVSVSIPTHADTVGYEEGDPRVTNVLKVGYPRFKIHSVVEVLMNYMSLPQTRNSFSDKDHDDATNTLSPVDAEDERELLDGLDYTCYVFPTFQVALRFQSFMQSGSSATSEISLQSTHYNGVTAAYFPIPFLSKAKAYWQHTGEIVSSRLAFDTLNSLGVRASRIPAVTAVHSISGKSRICASDAYVANLDLEGGDSDECDVARKVVEERILSVLQEPFHPLGATLTVSGMAAIFSALRLVLALEESRSMGSSGFSAGAVDKDCSIVVFGFPYLDTLKIMSRTELNPGGVHFLGHGSDSDLDELKRLLAAGASGGGRRIGAVFAEFPTNPLLRVPDLQTLTALAVDYDFLLVVDDTVGSFSNVDLLHSHSRRGEGEVKSSGSGVCVDILCSSLTKVFSGRGDVLAGSLVINSHGKHASKLRYLASTLHFAPLYGPDAMVLERNSRDYRSRSGQVSRSAHALALWLQQQPGVDAIYYPGVTLGSESDGERFDSLRREGSGPLGRGCLLSIVLSSDRNDDSSDSRVSKMKDQQTQVFFDALSCWKGPSLGTNFTLSCMYTLLAHYGELAWARSYGLDKRLVRISVGLEPLDELKDTFKSALTAAVHPAMWCFIRDALPALSLRAVTLIVSFLFKHQ